MVLWPTWVWSPKTTSWSVPPFLHGTRSQPQNIHTDHATTLTTCDICKIIPHLPPVLVMQSNNAITTVTCNCTVPGKFSMHTRRKSVFPNTWTCCKVFCRNETSRHKRMQLNMWLFHQLICTANRNNNKLQHISSSIFYVFCICIVCN